MQKIYTEIIQIAGDLITVEAEAVGIMISQRSGQNEAYH